MAARQSNDEAGGTRREGVRDLHPIVAELDQGVRVEAGEAIPHRSRQLIGQRGQNVLDANGTGSLDELPKHRAQYLRLRGVPPGRPPGLEPGIPRAGPPS